MVRFISWSLMCVIVFTSCSSNSSNDELTAQDLIIGTWVVQSAEINEVFIPVENTPFEKIVATFETDSYVYIFPKVLPNGQVSGSETDQISGPYEFNNDETMVILDRSSSNQADFEWEILELTAGNLKTRYYEQSANDASIQSKYEITYRLEL